jgi:hypothetical protein
MKKQTQIKSQGNSKMFLTDIKSKKVIESKKKYKNSKKENEIILPIIKKFQTTSQSQKKMDLKNFINIFKKDLLPITTRKKDDLNKDDLIKFNHNLAKEFLNIQKSKIESEIQNHYLKKTPFELQEYLNQMENKTSFKNILSQKKEELIEKKKIYNAFSFKLKTAEKNLENLNNLLNRYSSKTLVFEEEGEDKMDKTKNLNELEEIIKNITHERDCLDNFRKSYKTDLIILKKKSEVQKDKLLKLIKSLQSKNKELNKQEDMNNNVLNEFTQHKHIKSKSTKPFFTEEVHQNFSFFEEQIRVKKILSNEAKIQEAINLHNFQEKQREKEMMIEKENEKNFLKMENLKELRNELEEYEKKTSEIMEFLKVNEKMQILNKIQELKNGKESLKELKKCNQEDIDHINKDIKKIRKVLEKNFIQEANNFDLSKNKLKSFSKEVTYSNEGQLSDSKIQENPNIAIFANEQIKKNENSLIQEEVERKFNNELVLLEEDWKTKNQQLFNEKMELNQMNKIILDSSSTISRILFQLDPDMSSKIQISKDNIVELLSFVGLQLEKILSFLFIEGNVNLSCEELDYISDYDQNLKHTNQPPPWLRIHSGHKHSK